MKKNFVLVFVVLLVFGLVGCVSSGTPAPVGTSALAGKWVPEGGGEAPSGFPDDMELLKDGTGIVEGMGVYWMVENGRLYLTHPLMASSWNYKISGSSLTLTDDGGNNVKYIKR